MTAKAESLATRALAEITKHGAAGSLVSQADTYADGAVTGTSSTASVMLVGPVDESKRYAATGADTRTDATFYLAASGLVTQPKNADHIVFGGRTFAVVALVPYAHQGTTIAYQLDVGEIGNG